MFASIISGLGLISGTRGLASPGFTLMLFMPAWAVEAEKAAARAAASVIWAVRKRMGKLRPCLWARIAASDPLGRSDGGMGSIRRSTERRRGKLANRSRPGAGRDP